MDDVIIDDGGTSAIINPPFTSKINNHKSSIINQAK